MLNYGNGNIYVDLLKEWGYIMTDHATIYRTIRDQGLLERSKVYYSTNFFFIAILHFAIVSLMLNIPLNLSSVLVLSLIWTFTSVQIAALGHDANHYQIFSSKKYNDLIAFLCWNLGVGISNRWWQDQYNDHHLHPNDINKDPSIDLVLFSFSENQLKRKNRR